MRRMKTLKLQIENGVGWIYFHRPKVRNAVNQTMMEELEKVLDDWEENKEVKAIVFAGDEHSFVSGGDLNEFHKLTKKEEIYPVMQRMGQLLMRIEKFEKPTIAAVEATAVGGGCEVAVSCHFILASEKATFGFVQRRLGITTGWGGGSRLLRRVGRSKGLYLLLTGERVSSKQALQYGLVDQVISVEGFRESVQAFAEKISEGSLAVIQEYLRISKGLIEGLSPEELVQMESLACSTLWESEEHYQAVESFLSKK